MNLLPENELQAVETWFSDLKEALGVSQKTDRGRVLASVRKLVADNNSYNQEKRTVATALKYKRWGDLCTWASQQPLATPEVELPEVFKQPPNGVVFKPGGNYDKAVKRLVQTQLRVKEVWAELAAEVAAEPGAEEWAAKQKDFFVREFEATTDFDEFDQTCLAFVRNYVEEDPTEAWVAVADEASAVLERDYDLPATVVSELLDYAEAANVETKKGVLDWVRQTAKPSAHWFNYLLTAHFDDTNRPDVDRVAEVGDLHQKALTLWGCFEEVCANNPSRPKATRRVFDDSVTLAQVSAAVRKLVELRESHPDGTRDEFAVAVRGAVAAQTGEAEATTTA